MDGQLLIDYVKLLLKQEKAEMAPATDADILADPFQVYELGDIGACEFAKQTLLLRKEQSITTVDGTREYDCPPDFVRIAKKGEDERTDVILYTESGETEGDLIYRESVSSFWDNDTSQEEDQPGSFDIIEKPISPLEITGTTTAVGAVSNGEATLTAAAATFQTTGSGLVYPRYRIRNTTTGKPYRGIVLGVTSGTALKTAMFRDRVAQSWALGDTYTIQSSCKFQLKFDYKCATTGDTITLDYFCLPPPVFSPVGMWGFPDPSNIMAIACYVVWLLKLRNIRGQDNTNVNVQALTSDRMYLLFQDFVERATSDKRKRMHVPRFNPLIEVM